MDIREKAINLIHNYYSGNMAELIKNVCDYFDTIKSTHISSGDYEFLKFMANYIGIPQYITLLEDKYNEILPDMENYNIESFSSALNECSLITSDGALLHKYQKQILDRFQEDKNNRYILSAPTSFGKTFLVYEIIKKMKYKNLFLIFPTISLLSENYEKLINRVDGDFFYDYDLHTLTDDNIEGDKNIWFFTPERFLSFCDKNSKFSVDFIFVDEIYKIDNEFIIDNETTGENERDIAYRIALEYACRHSYDMLLAGPYMEILHKETSSFINFINDNRFTLLDYNKIEIVNKHVLTIRQAKINVIDGIEIIDNSDSKYKTIFNTLFAVTLPEENTIIYNNYKHGTEKYSKKIIELMDMNSMSFSTSDPLYSIFLEHIEKKFGSDWVVYNSLKHGIGIHHGLIPKYIQREIINLFNRNILTTLVSTTTITEGVNTSAKNIIITSDKKSIKPLKAFDAKNIAGRAGRFLKHYSGRVLVIGNEFEKILNEPDIALKHKNYDLEAKKDAVDYSITQEKYLNNIDQHEKQKIEQEIEKRNLPQEILNSFSVISPIDKIEIYDKINSWGYYENHLINELIGRINLETQISYNGFQLIIDTLIPIMKDPKLKSLSTTKCKNSKYSIVTAKLFYYLKGGFFELLNFALKKEEKDKAIRETADMIYNVFKYQLVKYLGVFDLLYKFVKSKNESVDINSVTGITVLVKKLEHNALKRKAQILNDYGVPFNLIDYYEEIDKKRDFDSYEEYIDDKVKILLESSHNE